MLAVVGRVKGKENVGVFHEGERVYEDSFTSDRNSGDCMFGFCDEGAATSI
jgi:hypothetical protein